MNVVVCTLREQEDEAMTDARTCSICGCERPANAERWVSMKHNGATVDRCPDCNYAAASAMASRQALDLASLARLKRAQKRGSKAGGQGSRFTKVVSTVRQS